MLKVINCPAVILAGGKSSRMKEDKSLLPFADAKTLAQYQYNRLEKIFNKVYISSKINKFDFLKDECFIKDIDTIYSPMLALESILQNISNEFVFIITVDTPFISVDTITKLYEEFLSTKSKILIPKDKEGNTHNLCGFFDKSLLPTITELIHKQDIHRIGYLIKHSNSKELLIDSMQEFINLNDKEQYHKACELIS